MRVEMKLCGFQEWATLPTVGCVPRVGETVVWNDHFYVVDEVRHEWVTGDDGSTEHVMDLFTHSK